MFIWNANITVCPLLNLANVTIKEVGPFSKSPQISFNSISVGESTGRIGICEESTEGFSQAAFYMSKKIFASHPATDCLRIHQDCKLKQKAA